MKHDFEMIEENLSHSTQKNVFKCRKCGEVSKMYIRSEEAMNDDYFQNGGKYMKECKGV